MQNVQKILSLIVHIVKLIKINKIYCESHKIKLTEKTLEKLNIDKHQLCFHDFEFDTINNEKIIIDYSIIKLKENFSMEICLDNLIFPRKNVNYHSYAFKITKIKKEDLEKSGLLCYEFFNLLKKNIPDNTIFFSNNCKMEMKCFQDFFIFMKNS
jgi:hypothetical protein